MAILPPGSSPHTYQLKPSDMRKVESATALIIGGRGLDDWALKFQTSHHIELIELIPKNQLLYFETEEKHEHEEEHTDHHHSDGVDPHFWTDPVVVKLLLPHLVDALCKIDPDVRKIYHGNAKKYIHQLDNLYSELRQRLLPASGKKVMLSHPFFGYFLKRFDIKLVGLTERSPGKEPTPKELKMLIETVKEENVQAIFCHIQLPDRSAKLVGEAAKINVFELDPIGGVKGRQTYEEMLFYNVEILVKALK
jgi:zinc transport system substrate-binding protein